MQAEVFCLGTVSLRNRERFGGIAGGKGAGAGHRNSVHGNG